METATIPAMNAWDLELLVVAAGSHLEAERRALARDAVKGLLIRIRLGVYAERAAYLALTPEHRHIVRMRAVAAVSREPVCFSHYSALVVDGLPVPYARLGKVHVTFATSDGRGRDGVAGHVFAIGPDELRTVHGLTITTRARTVIDVAGAAPFQEGVAVADAALHAGMSRALLEDAIEIAGPRQAGRRIRDVVRFAHPGAEGVNESYSRVRFMRMGFWPPELQHPLWDEIGFVGWLDFWFRRFRVGGEADGKVKLLDPSMATEGAGKALWNEKRREDRALPLVAGLARWGWQESNSSVLLQRKVGAFGVVPASPPATLADYAAAACDAQPRPLLLPR
jgi:hypothetical protein